jgi:hypothetical protein
MGPLPSRVFVSYAPSDRDIALRVADALRSNGVDAWLDAYIALDERWADTIREQIAAADAYVLLISPEQSESSRFELTEVLKRAWADRSKKVLPVLIGGAEPPGYLRDQRAARLDLETWSGLGDMLRYLTDQPGVQRPPHGEVRLMRRLSELEEAAAGMAEATNKE